MLDTQSDNMRFNFDGLRDSAGLERLDQLFLAKLKMAQPERYGQLMAYRQQVTTSAIETSELLIDCAKYLEDFLATYFGIVEEVAIAQTKTISHDPISVFKKYFVLQCQFRQLT